MIQLLINGMAATLPSDFSFTMEYENEYFTKSGQYSLDIELPLSGDANNRRIFGNIQRITAPQRTTDYEARIISNGRIVFWGSAILLKNTETSVSLQLVGDTSYFNYEANDRYIDEMDLGLARVLKPKDAFTSGSQDWWIYAEDYPKLFGSVDQGDMVFMWSLYKDPATIEDGTFYLQRIPNHPFPSINSLLVRGTHKGYLNCQPYLLRVIERIMQVLGFTITRNDIDDSWLRNLYICNYKIGRLGDLVACKFPDDNGTDDGYGIRMNKALPHWLLSTFIDECEKLLACIFIFNTKDHTVQIVSMTRYYDENTKQTVIADDDILKEYELDIEDAAEDNDLGGANISFSGDYENKMLKVDADVMASISKRAEYADYDSLLEGFNAMTDSDRMRTLFIDSSTGREYISNYNSAQDTKIILEVNQYADLVRDSDSSSNVELKIRPANVKAFDVGWYFDETWAAGASILLNVPYGPNVQSQAEEYKYAKDIIENGYATEQESGESSDNIEVMLSTGDTYHLFTYQNTQFRYPAPFTDFHMGGTLQGKTPQMSLSLKDVCDQSLGHLYRSIRSFRGTEVFVIRFLSREIPDVRQIFVIYNQRYVCRKLSVDFEAQQTSYVIEGEFYRLE